MAKQKNISFFEFQERFSSEKRCQEHLFQLKWPNGFSCPQCGHQEEAYEITTRNAPLFECVRCKHQTSLTAGTVMEKTRTPLRKWFWAIYLASNDKRGVSAALLKDQLEVCYTTAWTMLHKIRKAMQDRDSEYNLAGIIEIDDTYFGSKRSGAKRGRGTTKQKFMVGLSLSPKGHMKYVKIQSIPDIKGKTVSAFADKVIDKEKSFVLGDGYRSYRALNRKGFKFNGIPFDPENNPDHLRKLHIIIGNLKSFISGTFHGLGKKHIDAYLSEFCYRFNRRVFGKERFNRLLKACLLTRTVTYPELSG